MLFTNKNLISYFSIDYPTDPTFLDIIPVYPDSHQFVMEQRTEQYQDLLYAVEMLELVDLKAPRSQVLMEMWLLETEERKPPFFPETTFSVCICIILKCTRWSMRLLSFQTFGHNIKSKYGCCLLLIWIFCMLH